jgi:thiamine monophosphate synthase
VTARRLLLITDRRLAMAAGRDVRDVVEAAVGAGARWLLVRDKDLPVDERVAMAAWAGSLLEPVGGIVLVSSGPASAGEGVHLAAAERMPVPRPKLVGRSCHDGAELSSAAAEGCDYATLSPIFATPSKPAYGPPLGVDRLAETPLPVLALGGVTPANAGSCLRAGADGVAVMGGVMSAPDPRAAVRALLDAIAEVAA